MSIADRSVLAPGADIQHLSTAVLDINLQFMRFVPWTKAMTMYSRGSINIIQPYYREVSTGFREPVMLRTPSHDIQLPFIVTLKKFVYDPYAGYLRSNSPIATKRAILARDNYICAYQYRLGEEDGCTYKATTVDHIVPQARGKDNRWENLCAACQVCNNRKADRTPEEAGMPLLFTPETYDGGREETQLEIHEFLMSESGALL